MDQEAHQNDDDDLAVDDYDAAAVKIEYSPPES